MDYMTNIAAKMFRVAPEDVTAEQRARAKGIHYSRLYGRVGVIPKSYLKKK